MAVRTDWLQILRRVYAVLLLVLDRSQRLQVTHLHVALGGRAIHHSKLEARYPTTHTVVLDGGSLNVRCTAEGTDGLQTLE